jgi:signal transduction histidine kinase
LANTLNQPTRLAVVAPPPRDASLGDRIAALVELGVRTLGAERCAIAFHSGDAASADEVVYAPAGESHWDDALKAGLAALQNRLIDLHAASGKKRARGVPDSIESIEKIALTDDEIGSIARPDKIGDGQQFAAAAFSDGVHAVRIAIVARSDWHPDQTGASLELIGRAVLGEVALASARASLEFWRTQGAESGRQAVGAKRDLGRERADGIYLDEAVAVARRAQPSDRFGRFGQLVAGGAGFDQWVVAVADSGSFIVAASSTGQKQFDLGENSALAECFRRRIVIARWRDRDPGEVDRAAGQFFEDKMFGGSYVCIPFESGAIALAARGANASAAKAEAIVERLAPLATSWMLERDAARRNRLVRQLSLRMFAAIDEERARIARDLHDDQAQLIAAVTIALDGPREGARTIFKKVEQELRRKTRELRPSSLGNDSLDEAIEHESDLLHRAGVKSKFLHLVRGNAGEKSSRAVQQLCFQVVREALSNVIRHAHAKSVEITIESSDSAARVSIIDDGCGIGAGRNEGIGLSGVRERLDLMGGRLTLVSNAGGTTVVADIPESA